MNTMTPRNIRTIILAGLMLGCAPFSAQAQPASMVLNSSQPWKLQLVSAEEGQGVPFCALHKEYENQYELFLSMNPLGAMKILIKLAPGQFVSGKAYDVTLSLNNGYTKEFLKKEVYQDSIDLGLGKDPGFTDLLPKASVISARIDDKVVEFKIPDIAAAAKDLEYCISGGEMTSGQAGNLYDKPHQPKAVDTKKAKAQIDKTQTLLMGEERAPLTSSSAQLSIDERDLLESLKKKMTILEREKESLRSQLTNYRQDELTGLKEKMITTQSVNDYEEKTKILENKIKALEQQNTAPSCPAVPAAVEKAPLVDNVSAQKISALETQISTLQQELSLTQQENNNLKTVKADKAVPVDASRLKSLEAELATLKDENAKLLQRNAQMENQVAQVKANPAPVKAVDSGEMQSMKGEISSLRSQVEAANQRNIDLENKLSRAAQAATAGSVPEDLQNQLNYLQKENKALEKQLLSCQ